MSSARKVSVSTFVILAHSALFIDYHYFLHLVDMTDSSFLSPFVLSLLRVAFGKLQEIEATVVDGNGTETGHIIATTIGGRNGQPKQVC